MAHSFDQPLRRLAATLLTVAAALLAGCASTPTAPPPSPAPLLHDALFGHPARPAGADTVFAIDEPMRAHLREVLLHTTRYSERPFTLAESLQPRTGLKLVYDASRTRSASEAFAARAGNCLSLVVMTAALAREAGLEVGFQQARADEVITREDDFTLRSGHVNIVLSPRRPQRDWHLTSIQFEADRLLIDFLPQDELRGLRMVPIDEKRVLAMFMNNRAVESLLEQRPDEAYAWVREAVRQDAAFWPAYNTLGVVYQRAGHLVPATAAFERALDNDPKNLAAISNLEQALRDQGRLADAAVWTARRLALEPFAPGHFLRQGLAALVQGEADMASQHFRREMREHGPSPDLWLGLARAHLLRGERQQAEQALSRAAEVSGSPAEQARYAGKLDALRAVQMP